TYTGTGSVRLDELPATDWTFTAWSDDCSGTSSSCTLTLDGTLHEATVTYSNPSAGTKALSVDVPSDSAGNFFGDVAANDQISCGTNGDQCDANGVATGSTLTLVVDDIASGYSFSGWSGG